MCKFFVDIKKKTCKLDILSLSDEHTFERGTMPFKFVFLIDLSGSKGPSRFLVQMNPAALCHMKMCTFPMEITKVGAQILLMKMQNAATQAELNLKGATGVAAVLSKIA